MKHAYYETVAVYIFRNCGISQRGALKIDFKVIIRDSILAIFIGVFDDLRGICLPHVKFFNKKVARFFNVRTITRLVRNKTSCKASEN